MACLEVDRGAPVAGRHGVVDLHSRPEVDEPVPEAIVHRVHLVRLLWSFVREDEGAPETVPVPRSLVPHLSETAILLDIDGTLLDLMPTPREVWVPPGLSKTLNRLVQRTNGALALVSGRSLNDIDLIEMNEAFASQSLAVMRELNINPEVLNVIGGAIALGHPLGCSGTKLTLTLLHEMKRRNEQFGIVTMCIGGGMGAAGVFELVG
mgnify:CR=1 FL=1